MTSSKPWALLLLAIIAVGCGESSTAPIPPVEEWCDLDREREPCEIRGGSIENQADMAELCESSCTDIIVVNFQGGVELEVLKAFKGFRRISKINVSSVAPSVKDLSFLSDVDEVESMAIHSNPGLVSLDGIENLEFVKACEDCDRTISINYNPKLENLDGLRNVTELERIEINGNQGLEVINGFDKLNNSKVSIAENENLRAITGFASMTDSRGVGFSINPVLESVDGFRNLRTLFSFRADRNPNLNMCDVDRLMGQLTAPPEYLEIADTNGPPCME